MVHIAFRLLRIQTTINHTWKTIKAQSVRVRWHDEKWGNVKLNPVYKYARWHNQQHSSCNPTFFFTAKRKCKQEVGQSCQPPQISVIFYCSETIHDSGLPSEHHRPKNEPSKLWWFPTQKIRIKLLDKIRSYTQEVMNRFWWENTCWPSLNCKHAEPLRFTLATSSSDGWPEVNWKVAAEGINESNADLR